MAEPHRFDWLGPTGVGVGICVAGCSCSDDGANTPGGANVSVTRSPVAHDTTALADALPEGVYPSSEPIPFVVDRPFLFFIRDATGLVLFGGQVLDPSV